MTSIFHDMNFQKTDLNTVKELKEDGWRKAESEELQAFLGFYIHKKNAVGGLKAAIVLVALVFLVLSGELIFEMLCRNDPSYNPVPIVAGIVATALLLLFLLCVRQLKVRKVLLQLSANVYVTDAIAYGGAGNQVQVMVNHKRIAFDTYQFDEAVSPMDKVYQADGTYWGFHVLLYAVVEENVCTMKAVLGSQGYRHYVQECRRFEKRSGGLI